MAGCNSNRITRPDDPIRAHGRLSLVNIVAAMSRRAPLMVGLLLITAVLSSIFIGKCQNVYLDATHRFMIDAPSELSSPTHGVVDGDGNTSMQRDINSAVGGGYPPSYLQWNMTPPQISQDEWVFKKPRFCSNISDFRFNITKHGGQKIIVHFHMEHNVGTNFWGLANKFAPCALRSCWQVSKH